MSHGHILRVRGVDGPTMDWLVANAGSHGIGVAEFTRRVLKELVRQASTGAVPARQESPPVLEVDEDPVDLAEEAPEESDEGDRPFDVDSLVEQLVAQAPAPIAPAPAPAPRQGAVRSAVKVGNGEQWEEPEPQVMPLRRITRTAKEWRR